MSYVSVVRQVDPDQVRRRKAGDYDLVHDATAEELTNWLDTAIGFAPNDSYVDDVIVERFSLNSTGSLCVSWLVVHNC